MTLREKLLSNFPSSFNKAKPLFKALVANDKGTGTIEKTLTNLLAYMNEWRNNSNIYEMTGSAFKKAYSLITFLSMFDGETEYAFKERLKSIFVRGGDSVWGTPNDVQKLFENYFTKANVYIMESTDVLDNNLIEDYDFDSEADNIWTYTNCRKDKSARFSKAYGVLFGENGYFYQIVSDLTENKSHHIHFFHKGKVYIQIQSTANNKYWNGSAWVENAIKIPFSNTEWGNDCCHFLTEETTEIKLSFYGEKDSCIDYITMYEYVGYPTFKVFVQYVGKASANSLALAPGDADPTAEISNYSLAGYYEQVYLTGQSSGFSQQIYEELLSYVKNEGVKAYIEFVTKDN